VAAADAEALAALAELAALVALAAALASAVSASTTNCATNVASLEESATASPLPPAPRYMLMMFS